MLRDGAYTAREIADILGLKVKEVHEHLPHVQRSLSGSARIIAQPAFCMDCDFVFKDRSRLTTPGKCPVCRSHRISEPLFRIENKGSGKPAKNTLRS